MAARLTDNHAQDNGLMINGKEIVQDPKSAYEYAHDVVKDRWPEGEEVISKDPYWAYYYARHIIKGQWPEGEKAISNDPRMASRYAIDIIKVRWFEAENVIAKDPWWAYSYAYRIVKGRWLKVEATIANSRVANCYFNDFLRDRLCELDKKTVKLFKDQIKEMIEGGL